jgi:hypothetical protein
MVEFKIQLEERFVKTVRQEKIENSCKNLLKD